MKYAFERLGEGDNVSSARTMLRVVHDDYEFMLIFKPRYTIDESYVMSSSEMDELRIALQPVIENYLKPNYHDFAKGKSVALATPEYLDFIQTYKRLSKSTFIQVEVNKLGNVEILEYQLYVDDIEVSPTESIIAEEVSKLDLKGYVLEDKRFDVSADLRRVDGELKRDIKVTLKSTYRTETEDIVFNIFACNESSGGFVRMHSRVSGKGYATWHMEIDHLQHLGKIFQELMRLNADFKSI